MNTLIGLLIIAVGSFGQSSSYVPINKVKGWSWENFWLVQSRGQEFETSLANMVKLRFY